MSKPRTARAGRMRRPPLVVVLAATLLLAPAGDLRAQEADPESEGAAAGAAEEAAEALEVTALNRLTGKPLDETTPAPHRGTLDDGLPDKLPYYFKISRVESDPGDIEDFLASVSVAVRVGHPRGRNATAALLGPRWGEEEIRSIEMKGELDLGFDLKSAQIYDFLAILNVNDVPVDTFTTRFKPGNPVLSIRSTVTSGGGSGRESMKMTGKISGTSALEMSSDYLRLSGRGRIDYEDFELIPPGGCDAGATWEGDYYWEVLEVVLADSPEEFDASLESVGGFPPPVEVVVALDPSIDEVVAIRCGPVTVPIPGFKHFFPAFYSVHGDEMSEERRGLVMKGWMPGAGDVIATRTYERAVQIENVTITESTILELRWPE